MLYLSFLQQSPTWRLILICLHTLLMQHNFLICHSCRPTKVEHNFSLSIVTVFVNISAGFLIPWIFSNFNTSSSSKDRIEWYRRPICFVREWNAEFFAKCIALWISLYRTLFSCLNPNSINKPWSHIISLLGSVTATYSYSL